MPGHTHRRSRRRFKGARRWVWSTGSLLVGSLAIAATLLMSDGTVAGAGSLTCAPTGAGQVPLPGGGRYDVFDSLAQILPAHPQTGGSTASLCQARNGVESFQVQLTAGASALKVESVTASALVNGGFTIPANTNVSLYREGYAEIKKMSDGELSDPNGQPFLPRNANGECEGDCRFPDALIPNEDSLFKQHRKAFPFELLAGEDRVVWVDVAVPPGQAAGLYTGTLNIELSGGASKTVPISLQVIGATIPSKSSLHSAFYLTLAGGRVLSPAQWAEYAELGLDNRINIVPEGAILDNGNELEARLKPLLEGNDPKVTLAGAYLTDFPMHWNFGTAFVPKYKKVFENVKEATGRATVSCDEEGPQQCATNIDNEGKPGNEGKGIESAWPGLQVLPIASNEAWGDPKTAPVVPATTGNINLAEPTTTRGVVALANYLDPIEGLKPKWYEGLGSRMPAYSSWREQHGGRQIWAYTSCFSGGCEPPYKADSVWNGWPSYGMDQVATEQRAMPWQMYAYGIDGEVYWSVNNQTNIWTDPQPSDPKNTGMNGDGTLFYPWDETRVGGTEPVPVESIRLKRIRDGRQDYELLLLAKKKDATAVMNLVKREFPAMDGSAQTNASFDGARQELMGMVPIAPSVETKPASAVTTGSATLNGTVNPNGQTVTECKFEYGTTQAYGLSAPCSPTPGSGSSPVAVSASVGGLAASTEYHFRITAENAAGGERGADLTFTTPSGGAAPGTPTAVVGRTAKAAAAVSWKAPAEGGAPTEYLVTSSPEAKTCSTTGALTCTVKLLKNNTSYTFTVVAKNGSGTSPASLPSNPVVPVVVDSVEDFNCDGTADFMAVQAGTGDLLFYPRIKTGTKTDWSPSAPIKVGTGYGGSEATLKYRALFFAGDLNGDRAPDLIGVAANGQASLLAGDCTGQVGAPSALGVSLTTGIGPGDFNGDGRADVLDRHADGTLWLLPGTGKGSFGAAQQVGSGWNIFESIVAAGDLNNDKHVDAIGRKSEGTLLLYEGDGKGKWTSATENSPITLEASLPSAQYPVLIGAGDFDVNGKLDLAAVNSSGVLFSFPGKLGNIGAKGKQIGAGWQPSNLVQIVR